jgi:hypothetical protein
LQHKQTLLSVEMTIREVFGQTLNSTGTLICGAITAAALAVLRERGVEVIPWIRGSVEEVLNAHRRGTMGAWPFSMPGTQHANRYRLRHGIRYNSGGQSTNLENRASVGVQ